MSKMNEIRLSYDLTFRDVIDILRLTDGDSVSELHVELEDFKLHLVGHGMPAGAAPSGPAACDDGPAAEGQGATRPPAPAVHAPPAPRQAPATPPASPQGPDASEGVLVKAPLAGVFYRAPSPNAPPFVEVGGSVKRGSSVGMIEVMKLFTPVPAPCGGIVREIRVRNEEIVEINQVLVVIESAEE